MNTSGLRHDLARYTRPIACSTDLANKMEVLQEMRTAWDERMRKNTTARSISSLATTIGRGGTEVVGTAWGYQQETEIISQSSGHMAQCVGCTAHP